MLDWKYFREFVVHPTVIGSVAPCSRRLAREMMREVDWAQTDIVVEYGPGTGTFTERILALLKPGARVLAVEMNSRMASVFRRRFPDVAVAEDSVGHLPNLLTEWGASRVDCIISGLPWTCFGPGLQRRLLDVTSQALRNGGHFATVGYLPGLALPRGDALGSNYALVFQKFVSRVSYGEIYRRPLFISAASEGYLPRE